MFSVFVITQPGLESVTATELAGLGISVGETEPGGLSFEADANALARASVNLRTASRILVRLGSFHAASFGELERHARRLPWGDFISAGTTSSFRVTSKKSRLYHEDAIGERLVRAAGRDPAVAAPADAPVQQFVVRVFRDQVTVSADASGELLHRRGYRLDGAKAPLRETLAAAMLLGVGWDGSTSLVDPFAGSGTIPIEAAMIARGIAPGLHRGFAAESWPVLAGGGFGSAAPVSGGTQSMPSIRAADRDAGAVAAIRANAERAGVEGDISIRQAVISDLELPEEPGWIVTNPPYGVRVGERLRLRNLYAQTGKVLRARAGGWRLALLSVHPLLDQQLGFPLTPVWETTNGGIRVRLVVAQL